jgi:hypothetical protein
MTQEAAKDKMTPQSKHILEDLYKKNIAKAILNVDPALTRLLSFSQLRMVLTRLSLLGSGTQNDPNLDEKKKTRLLPEDSELLFLIHLYLVNLGSLASGIVKSNPAEVVQRSVRAEDMFDLLSVLLCPNLNSAKKLEKLIGRVTRLLSAPGSPEQKSPGERGNVQTRQNHRNQNFNDFPRQKDGRLVSEIHIQYSVGSLRAKIGTSNAF